MVFSGKWKGVDVAVKRFIKQVYICATFQNMQGLLFCLLCFFSKEAYIPLLFIQTFDESTLLGFRAEMAFLAELHHPNLVLVIGK